MPQNLPPLNDLVARLSRRDLLGRCGMGFGLIGLAGVLAADDPLRPHSGTSASPTFAVRVREWLETSGSAVFSVTMFPLALPGFYWTDDLGRYAEGLIQDPVVLLWSCAPPYP